MSPYCVSAPQRRVVAAYAKWRGLAEIAERTLMQDGWTLPSLRFRRLYEAHAAANDLAMISGSLQPLRPHGVLITEYRGVDR